MASLGAVVVTQAMEVVPMDSVPELVTAGATTLQFMHLTLLAIAFAEAYDFFGDCAWVKDLSTKWSLYVVNTELTRYKAGFSGSASDFTASYVRNPADDTMLGWSCWPNSTWYAQKYGTSSSEPMKPIVEPVSGDMLCSTLTPGTYIFSSASESVCIKLRYYYDESGLRSFLRAAVPGDSLIAYTSRSVGSATMYDVFPNPTTGFFDAASYVRFYVPCNTPLPAGAFNPTACGKPADWYDWYVDPVVLFSINVPMPQLLLPGGEGLVRSGDACKVFSGLFSGSMVIFSFTCALIIGKLVKHGPAALVALRARFRSSEQPSEEEARRRAVALAEVPFFSMITAGLMTKADVAAVSKEADLEAEHAVWARMLGMHRPDSLLTARYLPGTLLFRGSFSTPGRAQLPAGVDGLTLFDTLTYLTCVPFSPQANKLLYGWTAALPMWGRVVGAPFILCIHGCAMSAQLMSLMSLTPLIFAALFCTSINVFVYGDQKITLRLLEDMPQLIIAAVFTAKVERNTAAVVSIIGNVLMMLLQTAKDVYHSARQAERSSVMKREKQMGDYMAAQARFQELLQAEQATRTAAPPACCGCSREGEAATKAALKALDAEMSAYEEDSCACTAYPTCFGDPCTTDKGGPCTQVNGSPCCCCGAPCCVPGVRPWVEKLVNMYPDLSLLELLNLCFVTPMCLMTVFTPPFIFGYMWRLHTRRVPAPAELKADTDGRQECDGFDVGGDADDGAQQPAASAAV